MDEFYEGSEKLLEVWFPYTLNAQDDPDLRNIDRLVALNLILFVYILATFMKFY